jgi:asparagine synthase (glutamine-hydrolysing)
MCGIAGIIAPQSEARDAALARMLHALSHRGPDGEGEFGDAHAALGHRRLSIIDLEGGRQPLENRDGSIQLVCNGEIYNYRALREELVRAGYPFRTHSDCEVIIALYEREGDRLLERLRGMFAFVLWDARRRRVLAARDHLGQKPLYYTLQNGGVAFASEIKGLLAASARAPRMNIAALDQYLALRLIDAPLSMFEGVHKVPPGCLLTLEAGGEPQIRRYWDLAQAPKLSGPEDALLDELEGRVEEALRLHMVSDVPVGAFLSGGMDSSLLVAMLNRRLHVERLPTFTVGLDYQRYDEAPAARAVAKLFNTDHHEARVTPEITSLLPDLVWALDEPSDPLSACTWLLAQFTRQHVKVVIGGDGGDELFGGYDRYYGNLYASHYSRVPAALRRKVLAPAFSLIPESGWYKSVGHQLRWLHHLSFHAGGDRYAASLSYFYFDRERRRALFDPKMHAEWDRLDAEAAIRAPYEAATGDELDRMLYADSKVRLPNHPVMITDRICMAHGLEARSPFMDHALAEFAARLPSALKVRGGSLRYIQRKLAARYLPPEILNRPKQGFSSALPYLLQSQYAHLYSACLREAYLVRDGVLDAGAIAQLVQEHSEKHADHANRLWLLINAEVWYRMMILGHSREDLRAEIGATHARRLAG